MRIIFSSQAWEDYLYWQQTDRRLQHRLVYKIERDAVLIAQSRYHY
jgi:Txe/YoeB family toxin of Txe-Axe toxin-antitoxin module